MATTFDPNAFTFERLGAMTPTEFANFGPSILQQFQRQLDQLKPAVNSVEDAVDGAADAADQETVFVVAAADLTEEDTSMDLADGFQFPEGARLATSWVVRNAMEGAVELTPATVIGAEGPTFALADGETFEATVNGSTQTVTFADGTQGYIEPNADGPYDMTQLGFDPNTKPWFVVLDSGNSETVQFLITDAVDFAAMTAAEVITRLNIHFAGRAVAAPSGDRWRLTSNMVGIRSEVYSDGGFVPWAFASTSTAGTGTSVDVTETTVEEFANAVHKKWSGAAVVDTDEDDNLRLRTVVAGGNQTIEVLEHTAAALGLAEGTYTGTAATTAVIDFGIAGAPGGDVVDLLADGMNLLADGDGPGTGTNAKPSLCHAIGGAVLTARAVSNHQLSGLVAGGGSAALHVRWFVPAG